MSVPSVVDGTVDVALRRRQALPQGMRRLILFQFWDNLAFYGSRLLLVLYLLDVLVHPDVASSIWGLAATHAWVAAWLGLRSDQAFVSALVGLFGALASATPVIGGWLSDRFISRRSAVIAGALLMAAGHAMLALQGPFLLGLLFLAGGNGFYRGTASAMLANLFTRDDPRLPSAFQLSYFAANFSVVVAPLVCGTLGELVGWSCGFGAAGVAMLVGLAVFLSIPATQLAERQLTIPRAAAAARAAAVEPRLLLLASVALFLIGNEQLSNAMVVWLKASVDRRFGATTAPLTWFFSISPLGVAVGTAALARWRSGGGPAVLRRRIVRGCLVGGGAWALLALTASSSTVPALVVMLFLAMWGVAFALVLPSGAGLMAELTPEQARGRWLGIYYLMTMIASIVVGALAGLYGRMSHPAFIGCHAMIVLAGAAVLAPSTWRSARSFP